MTGGLDVAADDVSSEAKRLTDQVVNHMDGVQNLRKAVYESVEAGLRFFC